MDVVVATVLRRLVPGALCLLLAGCAGAAPVAGPASPRPSAGASSARPSGAASPTATGTGTPGPVLPGGTAAACPPSTGRPIYTTPATFPRTVALTFDDGPSLWTAQFVATLRRRGVHGTFFQVGYRIAQQPELTRLVVGEGNLVEDHTWSHPGQGKGMDGLSPQALAQEVDRAAVEIATVTGRAPCMLRAPQGKDKSAAFQAQARRDHLLVVNMIGTAHDYEQATHVDQAWVERITSRLVDRGDHPIILLHDGGGYRGNSLLALDRIITWYLARGYVFTDPLGRPFH